jgi:hypothetical protein
MNTPASLAIFPYLKTTKPIKYKDLVFRNIEDRTGVTEEINRDLDILSRIFFLRDDLLLKEPSYTIVERSSSEEQGAENLLNQLREFQILVNYIYSAPHPTSGDLFLTKEHASLYLCVPKRIPLSLIKEAQNTVKISPENYPESVVRGEINAYEVMLDFRSYLWVTSGSRVYPPAGRIWLNLSQDLGMDFGNRRHKLHQDQLIAFIASKPEDSHISNRILTAIKWYNRSTSIDLEEDVALVYLAIAFESLLGLEQGPGITARFRESINLLLGGFPRLESWLSQFYMARSQIVHSGYSSNLMFSATDNPKERVSGRTAEYRSLVSVGRKIFQLCSSTIVNGALMTEELKLSSMLYTNQQRLEKVCELLNKDKGTATERLQSVAQHIRDIDTYRFVNETGLRIDTLLGTGQLAVKTYLQTNPANSEDMNNLLKAFSTAKRDKDFFEALSKLKDINESPKASSLKDESSIQHTVFTLLDCIWHYTFMHYFWLKESRAKTI